MTRAPEKTLDGSWRATDAHPAEHPLASVLDGLIAEHEALVSVLESHRDAIGRADGAAIDALSAEESALFERIAALDARRRSLMVVDGAARPEMRVTEFASRQPEPLRTALGERARRLREAIERARDAHGVVKIASASMLAHLRGIMQQIGSRLSHAGTYGRDGAVRASAQVVTGLDVQS